MGWLDLQVSLDHKENQGDVDHMDILEREGYQVSPFHTHRLYRFKTCCGVQVTVVSLVYLGSRESGDPGAYKATLVFLEEMGTMESKADRVQLVQQDPLDHRETRCDTFCLVELGGSTRTIQIN